VIQELFIRILQTETKSMYLKKISDLCQQWQDFVCHKIH
jgi:hypothetical protein